MKRVVALVILQGFGAASLTGCATPDAVSSGAYGGPTFVQMPVDVGQSGLVGATPQLLSAEFGPPALMRVDGQAQVWLYHGASCGLNLILYPDGAGTPRVAMAAPVQDGADTGACSAALARAHGSSGFAQQSAPNAPAQIEVTVQPVAQPVAQPIPAAAPAPAPATAPPPAEPGAASDGLERASSS